MDRRRDCRHRLAYPVSVKAGGKVHGGVESRDVSASGLRFRAPPGLGLRQGQRIEIRIVAPVRGRSEQDSLIMATDAVIVRMEAGDAIVRFERPLAY
jgi:hypothetical protein